MDIRDLDLSLQPNFKKTTVGGAVGKVRVEATVPYRAPTETSGKVTYRHNKKTKITASGNRRGGMLKFSQDWD